LPGYKPQVLTFGTMIGFLIAISSFVLAIFMYILTLQKKSVFGVLKAIGVPNGYIVKSVNLQILLLTVIGMIMGLTLTMATGILLASKVPFAVQPFFFIAIAVGFVLFGVIGGLASVRAVTKIDPAEAIS
jgi:putative ABC transport system permease protein